MNQSDSDRFSDEFAAAGWEVAPPGAPADVVVVHTCAVTGTAERDGLRLARGIKRQSRLAGRPEPYVVLVGCAVEADCSRRIVEGVDLLVTREGQAGLVERVTTAVAAARPEFPEGKTCGRASRPLRRRALLKVQDGCDFCCAYCIVPLTRGRPASRPIGECLAEAGKLRAAGFHELVLTGCNLGCYRDGRRRLPELVEALAGLDRGVRIRLGSIEPSTVEREIVDLMASCPGICRHLHLPLQSGDAGILKAMGRRYNPDEFRAAAAYVVKRVPDLGLGCDVITGFPGETAEAFERTRRMILELPFSNLHVFPYSERPGTAAAKLPGQVPVPERKARARELIALLPAKRQAFASRFVGHPVEALIERITADGRGRGWSGSYLECRVAGVSRASLGCLVPFIPSAAADGELTGRCRSPGA